MSLDTKNAKREKRRMCRPENPQGISIGFPLMGTLLMALLIWALPVERAAAQTERSSTHKATIVDIDGNIVEGSLQEEEGQSVHPDDSLALVDLYHALDGPNWRNNSGWLVDMVEFWYGVDEVEEVNDDEWRVTRLEIRSNRANGEIPESIDGLAYLERITADQNPISGPFPIGLTRIETLQRIRMNNNYMNGDLPWEELVAMPNLERLEIQRNRFTGEISPIVGQFPRLERLRIYGMRLEGEIPPELGEIETMERLEIGENLFTGELPEEIGNLPNLERLDLRQTYGLNPGPIPDWLLNQAETLERLYLTGTNRTGEIPAWMNQMFQLERLYLGGGDEIGGEIPDLTFLDNLYEFRLDKANFEGPIPDWLARMPDLQRLRLTDNNFTGQIPDNFGDGAFQRIELRNLNLEGPMPDLRNLDLERINLRNIGFDLEEIPTWMEDQTRLERIELRNTGISDEIPEWMSNLPSLVVLDLSDNDITGGIPSWLENQTDLEQLNLSRTNVEMDEIPTWLANREQLTNLQLAGLGLEGEIPAWLGNLPFFTTYGSTIALDDNNLEGPIPTEFQNQMYLDSLNLANNNLSGELPAELSKMGVVEGISSFASLVVSGNEGLEGPVPMDYTGWDPDYMRVFWFDGTQLCEPPESEFQDWLEAVGEYWNPFHGDPPKTSVRSTGVICGQEPPTSAYNEDQPYHLRLNQNYPNPFNPATTIRYEIPAETHVRLTVYNVLGQQVLTLVNEHRTAGQYEVVFDASRFSSGTYFYRLETDDRMMTRTMMFVK